MKVEVRCVQCLDINENGDVINLLMVPTGHLVINNDKDQFQSYICPRCNKLIDLLINTLQEQRR